MELKNNSAIDLWKEAISFIKQSGSDFADNDNRMCREINNLCLTLEDVGVSNIAEPIELMIESKKWVYPSKDELAGIMFKEFQAPIYEYTYGGRIFNFHGVFDQVNSFIVPLLKKDKTSRRATLLLYDPQIDSAINNKNTPGIIYVQFRVINDKLNMTCHIRSNDLFFGWPANIFQLFSFLEYLSKKLEIPMGSITTFSNSAHIFIDDLSEINEVLGL